MLTFARNTAEIHYLPHILQLHEFKVYPSFQHLIWKLKSPSTAPSPHPVPFNLLFFFYIAFITTLYQYIWFYLMSMFSIWDKNRGGQGILLLLYSPGPRTGPKTHCMNPWIKVHKGPSYRRSFAFPRNFQRTLCSAPNVSMPPRVSCFLK